MRSALENPGAIRLKVELQSLGVRVRGLPGQRAGGAGPADGITIFIDDLVATVPTGAPYVGRSPYSISEAGDGSWELEKNGMPVGKRCVLLKSLRSTASRLSAVCRITR